MDSRQRGSRSLPSKLAEYTTKREMAQNNERRSFPPCPPLATKLQKKKALQKAAQKTLFPDVLAPKAVFFTKPVHLSKLYNMNKNLSYFEQIFAKSGKIGEGSFGEVFKVYSREDEKIYAVKQLKSSHHSKYGYAEVENYEKIGYHENCVKFFMAWEELQIVYIQMEFCELSLAEYAHMVQSIEEPQLWEILYDMLRALDHLHKKKLIHLDVKPGNILMSKGCYKLADFGLLVDLNKHDGKRLSTISDGDAKYLACEVLNGIYTASCDIFGLGISLLELATNIELPEFGPLWHQIRKDGLPAAFVGDFSPRFTILIEKMMYNNHWQRPSAEKVLAYPNLRMVHKKDLETPRTNYCVGLVDMHSDICYKDENSNNNNISETPRRPLHEVRRSFPLSDGNFSEVVFTNAPSKSKPSTSTNAASTSCQELGNTPVIRTTRTGLSRIKLDFS